MILIISTTDTKENAELIAGDLLDQRLAACVQIDGPINSHYWWDDKKETAAEWRLFIKSKSDCFDQVCLAIKAVHNYAVPQIIGLPLTQISTDYAAWMTTNLTWSPPPHNTPDKQKR